MNNQRPLSFAEAVPITRDDHLHVIVVNKYGTLPVTIRYAVQKLDEKTGKLDDQPTIVTRSWQSTTAAIDNYNFQLTHGYLLSVHVEIGNNVVQVGLCYVFVNLRRGAVSSTFVANTAEPWLTLIQDYVSINVSPSWPPQSGVGYNREGKAVLDIPVAAPAAQADWGYTVGASEKVEIQSIRFRLVADGNAANRQCSIQVDDGNDANYHIFLTPAVNVTAGQTKDIFYLAGFPISYNRDAGMIVEPMPPLVLSAGQRIRSNTTGLQVGDQYSDIIIHAQFEVAR